MKQGDYSTLARHYRHRAGYSHRVLGLILQYIGARPGVQDFRIVDVGAGTGKLTEDLLACGFSVICVEPNSEMRGEGSRLTAGRPARWAGAPAEQLPLRTGSFDWVLMGSSFHWTSAHRALAEFHRVLRPGGHFTALWNPRRIEGLEFHERIEREIKSIVPELKRVSSGAPKYTEAMHEVLVSTGHFADVILVEAIETVRMSPDRYLGAWESVNDVQAQAGPARWARILEMIRAQVSGRTEIDVPYRTRAFTATRVGN